MKKTWEVRWGGYQEILPRNDVKIREKPEPKYIVGENKQENEERHQRYNRDNQLMYNETENKDMG